MNAKVLFDEDGWLRLQAEVPKVELTFIFIIHSISLNSAGFYFIRTANLISFNLLTPVFFFVDEAHHSFRLGRET